MMNYPLTLVPILERAGTLFGQVEIVSRLANGRLHRSNFGEVYGRSRALAQGLMQAGLRHGDRVATLMGNHQAHLEAYFGIPLAGGAVHTLNLRLHPADLAYIVNHAEDRFLILDAAQVPLLEKFREKVELEKVFVVTSEGEKAPQGYVNYEDLLNTSTKDFCFPDIAEEDPAGMCYTSGTTGRPKGVLYSHRALVLGAFALGLTDAMGLSGHDVILQLVPMFHATAWGVPYAATMLGAKQVFVGSPLEPETLLGLLESERVTFSCGVPTVWLRVLDTLEKHPGRWKLTPELRVAVAGSAAPEALIRGFHRHGIEVIHGWGMTEIPPMITMSRPKLHLKDSGEGHNVELTKKQGLPGPLLEFRAVGENGPVAWDGESVGELQARGPWVADRYFNLPEENERWTQDGWFRTGDIVTLDGEGYMKIVDRKQDLINSGGEWISSLDLENALMGHPEVAEAAVVAVPHPEWGERPLAVVVLKGPERPSNEQPAPEEFRRFLQDRFAKWQLPDAFVFVEEIPRTAAGKFHKSKLREQFRDWKW